MANNLIFKDSTAARDAIMDSQKKEIAALYESWADEIGERANYYSHKYTASAPVSERYYRELQKQLRATSQEVSNEVYSKIKKNMYTVADAVVADNVKWLESFGFKKDGLNAAFSYVPDEIVRNLITGQIYDSGWSLSSRIWGDNEKTLKDIYQVMAKGLAENKPIYEIAKDLESYVRPSAKLPWNLRMADGKKIYKKQVDYNAQRLARTLVQHGYQQSFIATTQKNPFITEYVWRSNGSRVCKLCAARDGAHFKKTELPLDHPNGMCTMEPVVADDMIDQLADWFNSPDGTYPEIDAFAGNFGYQAQKVGTAQDFVNKYGMSTKSPNAWFNSLTPIQKAEAKALKEQSGLTWNKWYEQNIHSTGDATQDFIKKYGTSTKSPNAWYNSLSSVQKAEAKALKEQSGLTWNEWYNKNIYAGKGTAPTTKTAKAFSATQDKYLSPYGFSPDNMPKNFDDWSHKVSHEQAGEILKSMGTSWADPHPYQQLMKYYNENLTSGNFVDQAINSAATAKKAAATAKKAAATKADDVYEFNAFQKQYLTGPGYTPQTVPTYAEYIKKLDKYDLEYLESVAKKNGYAGFKEFFDDKLSEKGLIKVPTKATTTAKTSTSIPDSSSWLDKVKAQKESHMLDLENESMKLIGEAGRKGIVTYSGSSYEEMNSYLRYLQSGFSEREAIAKSGISSSELQQVKDAIAGLDNAKLTEDLVLRRGTDLGDLAGAFMQGDFSTNKESLYGKSAAELNQMFQGTVGQYGSFTSTSSIWDRGFSGDVEVVIYAPKGTSASSIMSISRFGTSEGETLLNAGTTVRCVKVEESDGHKGSNIRVFMEVITK